MSEDPYKYFRVEAREILEGLSHGVLELEKGPVGPDFVACLLRLAHTLKGASRVVKQPAIADLSHALEDVLAPYRETRDRIPRERIDAMLGLLDAIRGGVSALGQVVETGPAAPPRPAVEDTFQTVRVEVEEMDALLEGVLETSTQLSALRSDLKLAEVLLASSPLGRSLAAKVDHAQRELGQVHGHVDRLRLLPASSVLATLERAVRDAAHSLQKRVEFRASGGEQRLDAHVLAALRDALLHVVRNAVAHGIETEAQRVAVGKPPAGCVDLTVERRGNRVTFTCRDDGRGIDVEAVRRAAVSRGLLSPGRAASLTVDEVVRLILKGGVTTAGAVTWVSGRGIGLDVVRDTVARLKGEVKLETQWGRGTVVELSVPVSLASLPALILEAGGTVVCLPLDAVRSTLRVALGDVARSAEGDTILFEGRAVPFRPLAAALKRESGPSSGRGAASAVVVQAGNELAALSVDRLVGTGVVTIRSLPSWMAADPLVAGAALDQDGRPQLVLDPGVLVAAARSGGAKAIEAKAPPPPILIVDDSLTTRMLEKSILESAGYQVELASSAEDALAKAQAGRYGLFIVDVEMPGMDGFGFIGETRRDPALRGTPSILVTSRNSPEDRRRGAGLGVSAYIVKSEFDQGYLLGTIRELVG